ncbi:MAG TPA: CoA-binding protein [Saprospiraceae bacterium]|nr:CoA-binding protein [Saprospiraceae bacterium]
MNSKTTAVIGASPNQDRYSYKAVEMLTSYHHEVIALGQKTGTIADVPINTDRPNINVDTVSLYLNPTNQESWYSYILQLRPRRIIFNPGTENPVLSSLAQAHGIECTEACTLVLLSTGQYD